MTLTRYPVPAAGSDQPHCTELLIRRSRFLAQCAHTPGPEAARAFVESVRRLRSDAAHNCWAYAAARRVTRPGLAHRTTASPTALPDGPCCKFYCTAASEKSAWW